MAIDLTGFPNLSNMMNTLKQSGFELLDTLTKRDLEDCEHFVSESKRLSEEMKAAAKSLGSKELARGIFYDDIRHYINQFKGRCLKQPVASPASATTPQPTGGQAFWATTPFQILGGFQHIEKSIEDVGNPAVNSAVNAIVPKIVAGGIILYSIGSSVLRFVATRGASVF